MKILVNDIQIEGESPVVAFSSEAGVGRAICSNQRIYDFVGSMVDVELDVEVTIRLAQNALATDADLGIYEDGIVCEVEAQDEDGMAYCRLSQDCLLMVESIDALLVGQRVRLVVPVDAMKITLI